MNMYKINVVLIFFVLLQSCKGTSTGNPPKTNIAVTATDQVLPLAYSPFWNILFPSAWALPVSGVVDANANTVRIDESWISIKDIRIELSGDLSSDDTRLNGPFVVDLLSENASLLADVNIHGSVDELRWDLEKTSLTDLPSGAPSELVDNSFILVGKINSITDFTFLSDETTSMRFESETFSPASSNLVINILLKELFSKIDLTSVTDNEVISSSSEHPTVGSKCPEIDPSANDLYTCFRKGLESEAVLGQDNDDDFIKDD